MTAHLTVAAAPPRRFLRSAGAVVAGFLAIAVVSLGTDQVLHVLHIYPPWGQRMSDSLFLLASAYRAIYCLAGSYLTARLAPDRPLAHALALGVLGLAVSTAGAVATWNADLGPRWYPVSLAVTALPLAWLGGWMAARRPDGAPAP